MKKNINSTFPSYLYDRLDYDQDLVQIESHKNSDLKQSLNISAVQEWFETIKNKLDFEKIDFFIKSSFMTFDIEKKNEIDVEDLKNCLYTMNLCPTNEQLSEIYKLMNVSFAKRKKNQIDHTINSKISYEIFSKVIVPILVSGIIDLRSEEILEKAFKVISNGEEKIDWKKMEDLLCSNEYKFKNEEIEIMKDFVSDFIEKDKFFFRSFIPQLTKKIDHESFFKNSTTFSQDLILKDIGFNK